MHTELWGWGVIHTNHKSTTFPYTPGLNQTVCCWHNMEALLTYIESSFALGLKDTFIHYVKYMEYIEL